MPNSAPDVGPITSMSSASSLKGHVNCRYSLSPRWTSLDSASSPYAAATSLSPSRKLMRSTSTYSVATGTSSPAAATGKGIIPASRDRLRMIDRILAPRDFRIFTPPFFCCVMNACSRPSRPSAGSQGYKTVTLRKFNSIKIRHSASKFVYIHKKCTTRFIHFPHTHRPPT